MFTRNWYIYHTAMFTNITPWDYQNSPLQFFRNTANTLLANRTKPSTITQTSVSFYGEGLSSLTSFVKSATMYSDTSYRSTVITEPYGVVFGNGTDAESIDSYKMTGDIFTTYNVNWVRELTYTETGTTYNIVYTLTNTGEEAFTVSEIGLLGCIREKYNGGGYYYFNNVLMERTLLETPITIEPGGVGQVTYTLHMDNPAAVS